jgi:DNA-binding XRE family transcriptional regulator
MSDLQKYIQKRAESDKAFAENYEEGFAEFRIGVILRQAREAAGLTQDDVAKQLNTNKSAISRIENHADDIRLSTIHKYAKAVGAKVPLVFG